MAIIVHLNGDNWKTHSAEYIKFNDADMSDWNVKKAFQNFISKGFNNVNCVMEDTQSPREASTRWTKPYTYNQNGDVIPFVYDDSFRRDDMAAYYN